MSSSWRFTVSDLLSWYYPKAKDMKARLLNHAGRRWLDRGDLVNIRVRTTQHQDRLQHYLFDQNLKLVYRDQSDGSRPGNGIPVSSEDLRAALDAVLARKPVSADQRPSVGCNITWKRGNEPDY